MNALRSVFVIFLYFVVVTEGSAISNVAESSFGKRSDGAGNAVSTCDNGKQLYSIQPGTSIRRVDCSDLNSTLGRALKWLFELTSAPERLPQVQFLVSTRNQRNRVEVHLGEQFRLDPTDFKIERRTVFIVHGFKGSGFKDWVKRMEDAFLQWGDINIVVVDWSKGPNPYNYYDAAVNTRIVGNQIAKFLHHVVNATTIGKSLVEPIWGTLHLVCHSLGAHICGVAARDFKEMQNQWNVSRITGLDPAKFCFQGVSSEFRLDRSDADFVDIIHTSAKPKSIVGFGILDPIGHIDFYVNGGETQPGCSRREGSVLSYLGIPNTPIETSKCSHRRSYRYFTESLIGAATGICTFWGRQWNLTDTNIPEIPRGGCFSETCTEMGIASENSSQLGTFFVVTSSAPPFCIPLPHD